MGKTIPIIDGKTRERINPTITAPHLTIENLLNHYFLNYLNFDINNYYYVFRSLLIFS